MIMVRIWPGAVLSSSSAAQNERKLVGNGGKPDNRGEFRMDFPRCASALRLQLITFCAAPGFSLAPIARSRKDLSRSPLDYHMVWLQRSQGDELPMSMRRIRSSFPPCPTVFLTCLNYSVPRCGSAYPVVEAPGLVGDTT
ncbi:hypothetical protein PVAG01_01730 [Phlyctema vagabunda]|uniref:Secreted protein n=1 Tax=Phlyctema vagabunda TaxID=108571 RepID=A0ABR4PY05_9HELO